MAPLRETHKGQPVVSSKLKLTGALSPGEYYLQVTARSQQGQRETMAAQWPGLELAN